jgi:molybdopterin converting factor small subunit
LPVVGIPSLLRDLTGGEKSVPVEGETVRQVIENLEQRFPGLQERLCDSDVCVRITVIVDGSKLLGFVSGCRNQARSIL